MSEYIASVEGLFTEEGITPWEFGFETVEKLEEALQDTVILSGANYTLFSTEGSISLLTNALAVDKFFDWASED